MKSRSWSGEKKRGCRSGFERIQRIEARDGSNDVKKPNLKLRRNRLSWMEELGRRRGRKICKFKFQCLKTFGTFDI